MRLNVSEPAANAREALDAAVGASLLTRNVVEITRLKYRFGMMAWNSTKSRRKSSKPTPTKEKGTAWGWQTVKHNVELYGGTVRVESELERSSIRSIIPAER